LKRYHAFAWAGATVWAAGLLVPWTDSSSSGLGSETTCGAYFIGGVEVDYLPVCYLSNFKSEFVTFNTLSHFVFFYMPVAAVYFYAVNFRPPKVHTDCRPFSLTLSRTAL
jgi:hypothetical protein